MIKTPLSTHKLPWALLILSVLILQSAALYFQYALDLLPCVKCINQRAALYGVLVFAVLGYFTRSYAFTRGLAILGWLATSLLGVYQAYQHVDAQENYHPMFSSCEMAPFFPSWLPLHDWLPAVFRPTGDCGIIDWQFLGFSMPQWMLVAFSAYTFIAALTLFSQIKQAFR